MKMNKPFIVLIMLAVLAALSSYAQQQIIPPSPGASSIGQHVNSPVSLHTGTLDVNIPLWTLNSSKLSTGVSLSYHGSGIQPGSKSEVGYGWSLNAGGGISRTVRGLPDESPNGWKNNIMLLSDLMNPTKFNMLDNLAKSERDDMPDLYSFSFPGYSGQFIIEYSGGIITIPYQDLLITNNNYETFTITTPYGEIYSFGGEEANILTTVDIDLGEDNQHYEYTSEWNLTNIKTPDSEDEINFQYEQISSEIVDVIPENIYDFDPNDYYDYNLTSYTITIKYNKLYLKNIQGKNSSINFKYNSKYMGLEIRNHANEIVSEFSFYYSLGQLISIVDHNSTEPPMHFKYNGLPGDVKETDHWGYYNASSEDNDPNFNALKGILEEIHYPSGGYKKFSYEIHTDGTFTVGGARISGVELFDHKNHSVKNFIYEDMRYTSIPDYSYKIQKEIDGEYVEREYTRSFNKYPLGNYSGSHVSYGKVTVQQGGSGKNGKTVIYYSNDRDFLDTTESHGTNAKRNAYPYPMTTNMDWKRGLVDSVFTYRKDNNEAFVLINKEINEYTEDVLNRKEVMSLKVGYQYKPATTNDQFMWRSVKIISSRMLLSKSYNYDYERDGVNNIEDVTSYYYKFDNKLLEREEELIKAENKKIVTHILYPEDYAREEIRCMHYNEIKQKPIEVVIYYKLDTGTNITSYVLSGSIYEYDCFGRKIALWELKIPNGKPIPMDNFKFSNQLQDGLPTEAPEAFSPDLRYYKKTSTYDLYKNGNMVQTTTDSLTTTIIYAYNYTYPIASISNANYQEVTAILPETNDLFTLAHPDDSYIRDKMDMLRDSLPQAMIISSTYDPVLKNRTSSTNINGLTTYNEYDEVNRLTTVKDDDQNIIKHISYENNVFQAKLKDRYENTLTISLTEIEEATRYEFVYTKDLLNDFHKIIEKNANGSEYELTLNSYFADLPVWIWVKAYNGENLLATSHPFIIPTSNGLYLSTEELYFGAEGGELTVYIDSYEPWTVQGHDNNCDCRPSILVSQTQSFEHSNREFTIICFYNTTENEKTRTLTIQSGDIVKYIHIYQEGKCEDGYSWDSTLKQCVSCSINGEQF